MKIIVLCIVAAIAIVYIFTRLFAKSGDEKSSDKDSKPIPDADCCGAHEICEKETLISANAEIVYYQDEELDKFSFKLPDCYTNEEIEQFREILFTMRDYEVAGWLRSLQLRNIAPPDIVREEALMIVADVRQRRLLN